MAQERGNGACCGFHKGEVRLLALQKRGGHGQDEDVGLGWDGAGFEPSGPHCGLHQHVQGGFVDEDLSSVERFHHLLVNVHAVDAEALGGQQAGRGQSDVAQADHADAVHVGAFPCV